MSSGELRSLTTITGTNLSRASLRMYSHSSKPDSRGKVTYLQITPKSRSEIPEYVQMEQLVSQAAGRINGAYGEADWTPKIVVFFSTQGLWQRMHSDRA